MPRALPCLLAVLMLSPGLTPAARAQTVATEEQDRQAIRTLSDEYGAVFLPIVQTPWYREFIDLEPDRILRQVTVPVLISFGQNDPIVPYAVNATALVDALERGENKDYTVVEIPGTAHNYERADAGGFSEEALETLTVWLREKARVHKPPRQ